MARPSSFNLFFCCQRPGLRFFMYIMRKQNMIIWSRSIKTGIIPLGRGHPVSKSLFAEPISQQIGLLRYMSDIDKAKTLKKKEGSSFQIISIQTVIIKHSPWELPWELLVLRDHHRQWGPQCFKLKLISKDEVWNPSY